MRKEAIKWHLEVISTYSMDMYETLIYDHNITTTTLKSVDFEGMEQSIRGYFAIKPVNNIDKKYFIDETIRKSLPIRANGCQELTLKTGSKTSDIVLRPLSPIEFKITPKKMFKFREFIDDFIPFRHTEPDQWTLMKLITIASYVTRTYIAVCSESEFGKSSSYDVMHLLTDKSPVFKPRSIPGVLHHINSVGVMVFDEVHDCEKKVKEIIEEISLYIAGGKTYYINGAMKAKGTKQKYDCMCQSITFLYNVLSYYKEPKNQFFDFIFANNDAMDTRFLKLKLKGRLTERFDKDFNIQIQAVRNKMLYINYAKMLEYLRNVFSGNEHKRRYKNNGLLRVKGRRRITFDAITLMIDMYAKSQTEYDKLLGELEETIIGYKEMVNIDSVGAKVEVVE